MQKKKKRPKVEGAGSDGAEEPASPFSQNGDPEKVLSFRFRIERQDYLIEIDQVLYFRDISVWF